MSGHSKFANIKHKKEKNDAKKGKIFTVIGREIAVAVKEGGPDPDNNSKLRDVIAKAKANNMPNDTIDRGIKKAAGNVDAVNYVSITYEGYGPNGTAIIVEALTDNKNRTAGDIRHHFDKCGGAMGTSGCVSYMFETKGVIIVEGEGKDEDEVMMIALDCGANDIQSDEDVFEIYTDPTSLGEVREAIEKEGTLKILSAQVDRIPSSTVKPDKETEAKVIKLLDMLEDNDDVQNVYHNAELEEEDEEE